MVNQVELNKLHKNATIEAQSGLAHEGTDRRRNLQQPFIAPKFQNRILICHRQDNIRFC